MVDPTSPPPAASSAQNGSGVYLYPSTSCIPANDICASVEKISPSSSSANPDSRETYLSLLPHEQIIEICLLFEPHVPLHVKATVWPADLGAAILELKKKTAALAQPQPQSQPDPAIVPTPATNGAHVGLFAHQVHPPGRYASPPPLDEVPPMGSLRNPAEEAREKEKASVAAAASTSTATLPSTSHPPTNNGDSSTRQATPGSHAATSLPQGQPATLHPPAPYPYGPYGYPMPPPPQGQQGAYPHTPYYSQPGYSSHYPYPHYPPGYPAPPPGPTPPPPHAHGSQPLFNSSPLVRPPIHPSTAVPQPPPPPPSGEDLPSYEEMIVEALLDCGESEGAAPKDLFTWMASRYPLQTNFRPSASQALQKAYKRGRLEKRAGGKYRLNASWEGGAVRVQRVDFRIAPHLCSLNVDIEAYDASTANPCPDYLCYATSSTTNLIALHSRPAATQPTITCSRATTLQRIPLPVPIRALSRVSSARPARPAIARQTLNSCPSRRRSSSSESERRQGRRRRQRRPLGGCTVHPQSNQLRPTPADLQQRERFCLSLCRRARRRRLRRDAQRDCCRGCVGACRASEDDAHGRRGRIVAGATCAPCCSAYRDRGR